MIKMVGSSDERGLLWEGRRGRWGKERRSLVLVASEASLVDWLTGKCGVLGLAWPGESRIFGGMT